MCRSIKTLYNLSPDATSQEIHDASLQFVRKLSGYRVPSEKNTRAFAIAVEEISKNVNELLRALVTQSKKRTRKVQKTSQR